MKKRTILAGLVLFSFAGLTQAALLTNGDFQTGDLTGWINSDGNVTVTTGGGGNSVARLDGSGADDARLIQKFDMDPAFGSHLNVQFDFKLNGNDYVSSDYFKSFVRLELDGGGSFSETIIKVFNNTDGWQHVVANIMYSGLDVAPPPNNARVTFLLKGFIGDHSNAVLDNVVVNQVPVPAALFMFAPALLGFMGLRRRAKNKT